jgi:hypothetical protein
MMMPHQMFVLWIALLLTGCGLIRVEIPKEETPGPPPTPILCAPLPENMTFQVTPLSATSLQIDMTGLQQGEIPVVNIQAQTTDGGIDRKESSSQPIDATGQLTWTVSGMDFSSIGPQPPYWHVLVIHAQGVACTTITLP